MVPTRNVLLRFLRGGRRRRRSDSSLLRIGAAKAAALGAGVYRCARLVRGGAGGARRVGHARHGRVATSNDGIDLEFRCRMFGRSREFKRMRTVRGFLFKTLLDRNQIGDWKRDRDARFKNNKCESILSLGGQVSCDGPVTRRRARATGELCRLRRDARARFLSLSLSLSSHVHKYAAPSPPGFPLSKVVVVSSAGFLYSDRRIVTKRYYREARRTSARECVTIRVSRRVVHIPEESLPKKSQAKKRASRERLRSRDSFSLSLSLARESLGEFRGER